MSQTVSPKGPSQFVVVDVATFTAAVVAISRHFGDVRPWWRGQRDATWPLAAGVHRRGLSRKEANLANRFRLMARSRSRDCPSNSDAYDWLFLMQHYRLPTRLLDWSQSPLVALFFALEEPDNRDAVLWALSPTHLNQQEMGQRSICLPGASSLGQLGVQAFRPELQPRDSRVLSVITSETDVRHMVQQSAFTIHGRAEPLDHCQASSTYLLRVLIPAAAKRGLRQLLAIFGINRAGLFPDLEHLAVELSSLDFEDSCEADSADSAP